jgi:hypothetical protein
MLDLTPAQPRVTTHLNNVIGNKMETAKLTYISICKPVFPSRVHSSHLWIHIYMIVNHNKGRWQYIHDIGNKTPTAFPKTRLKRMMLFALQSYPQDKMHPVGRCTLLLAQLIIRPRLPQAPQQVSMSAPRVQGQAVQTYGAGGYAATVQLRAWSSTDDD